MEWKGLKMFKKIDIIVIIAIVALDKIPVETSDPEKWKSVIKINLIGAYNCIRLAIHHLINNGEGKIITIGRNMLKLTPDTQGAALDT